MQRHAWPIVLLFTLTLASPSCGGRATDIADGGHSDSDRAADGDADTDVDADADADAETSADAETTDSGSPICEAMVVSDNGCVTCDDPDEVLGAFWNGVECRELLGCECDGPGCERLFPSVAECRSAHSSCDVALCMDTGGTWHPAEPCGPCGHFSCGVPSGDDCCGAGCDCGIGRSFVADLGCATDAACGAQASCEGSGGQWHPASDCICGFTCGAPNDCEACVDSCDCGPHRTFDTATGCEPSAECGASEQDICEATGGAWHDDGSCGDYFCGIPNIYEPCVMPGCDCGLTGSFDVSQGCLFELSCLIQDFGQICTGSGFDSTCRPGLACCSSCGAMLCPATCQTPCCEGTGGCEGGCPPPPP